MSSYVHNKTWRIRHPKKRYESKKRYYRRHRNNPQNRKNSGQEWTPSELKRITARVRPPDSVLARKIGRSVEAVQVKRSKLCAK